MNVQRFNTERGSQLIEVILMTSSRVSGHN